MVVIPVIDIPLLMVAPPVILALPATVRVLVGFVVPMPTFESV